mgnify:FL=1
MTNTLKIAFDLPNKKTFTLSVADPKDGITKTEVQSVAEDIISKQAFLVDGAALQSIKSIKLYSSGSTDLA